MHALPRPAPRGAAELRFLRSRGAVGGVASMRLFNARRRSRRPAASPPAGWRRGIAATDGVGPRCCVRPRRPFSSSAWRRFAQRAGAEASVWAALASRRLRRGRLAS